MLTYVNVKVNFMTTEMKLILNKHAPKKKRRVMRPFNPWLTDNLIMSFKGRTAAWRKYN